MKWNTLFEKLKKIPAVVQSLVVGASVLFAELVALMQEFDTFLLEFARLIMASELDTSSINLDMLASTMAWLFYIFAFIFGILFFELIAYIVYRGMYGRRQIDGDRGYVMTVMRSVFITYNVGIEAVRVPERLRGFIRIRDVGRGAVPRTVYPRVRTFIKTRERVRGPRGACVPNLVLGLFRNYGGVGYL